MWTFSFRQIFSDELNDICTSKCSHVIIIPRTVMTRQPGVLRLTRPRRRSRRPGAQRPPRPVGARAWLGRWAASSPPHADNAACS